MFPSGKALIFMVVLTSLSAMAESLIDEVEIITRQVPQADRKDALRALGPEVVTTLCEALDTYKYPPMILSALKELEDVQAIPYIIDYFEANPYEYPTSVVRALRALEDPRSEEVLVRISNENEYGSYERFYATVALARFGGEAAKQEAWATLTEMSKQSSLCAIFPPPDCHQMEVSQFAAGLCEVHTPEMDEWLAGYLKGRTYCRDVCTVIGALGQAGGLDERPQCIEALFDLAKNAYKGDDIQGDELYTHAAAFEVLLNHSSADPERLFSVTESWPDALSFFRDWYGEEPPMLTEAAKDFESLRAQLLESHPYLIEQVGKDPAAHPAGNTENTGTDYGITCQIQPSGIG